MWDGLAGPAGAVCVVQQPAAASAASFHRPPAPPWPCAVTVTRLSECECVLPAPAPFLSMSPNSGSQVRGPELDIPYLYAGCCMMNAPKAADSGAVSSRTFVPKPSFTRIRQGTPSMNLRNQGEVPHALHHHLLLIWTELSPTSRVPMCILARSELFT